MDPSRSPARLRTAFGRTYYALYLLVRKEISTRYHVAHRYLPHGALYTHRQSVHAHKHVRELGRELQRMYTLRQKADYELGPDPTVQGQLDDPDLVRSLIDRVEVLAQTLPRLDFAPVVPLFRP
jgi:hypothetical protein